MGCTQTSEPGGDTASSHKYALGQLLGKGTFGDVYIGHLKGEKDRYAVKLVNKAFLREGQAQARLLREIQIQQSLSHPNVLRLVDFYEDGNFVYLVTELCEGGELLGLVKQRGGLPEEQARKLFQQMAHAVDYLHSKSIMHRDIKLANILLSQKDPMQLKIADFGLAAALESCDSERMTVCGTPNYLSPEIALHQPYSFASDLWSLGVALYTMLAGVPPFQGRQVSETLQRVKSGTFTVPDSMSPSAADLIRGLLQVNPRSRLPLQAVLQHSFLQPGMPRPEPDPPNTSRSTSSQASADILELKQADGPPEVTSTAEHKRSKSPSICNALAAGS
eukprot:scaffold647917_cov42-Prasinocladus_malaysianus.AAC.1